MADNRYAELEFVIAEGVLSYAELMSMLEKTARKHIRKLGVSSTNLLEKYGAFWMLCRSKINLLKPIEGKCRLKIITNHRDYDGILIYRDFDIFKDDEYIGEAVQCWILVKAQNKSLLRPKVLKEYEGIAPEALKTEKLPKLMTPADMEPVGDYTVKEQDIDFNVHMNNASYVRAAEELIHPDVSVCLKTGFLKERILGQTLHYYKKTTGDSTFVKALDDEGSPCFTAEFVKSYN